VTCVVDPSFDLARVEGDELADLEEGDSPFGHEASDELRRHPEA